MKTLRVFFLFICFIYSMQAMDKKIENMITNNFQLLPPEMQAQIASHLDPFPGFENESQFQQKNFHDRVPFLANNNLEFKSQRVTYFENNSFKIYIEDGNVKYRDKKADVIENLVEVNTKSFIRKCLILAKNVLLSGYYNAPEDQCMQVDLSPKNKITQFAVSPNQQYLIALESLTTLEKEITQNKLWLVDLKTKSKKVIQSDLFSTVCLNDVPDSEVNTFNNLGYKLTAHEHKGKNYSNSMKKLFLRIAVSNRQQVILADRKNVYSIEPQTGKAEMHYSFDQVRKTINAIQFNNQGSIIKISSEKPVPLNYEGGELTVTEYTSVANEPLKTLDDYFKMRKICKPEQLH